MSNTPNMSYCQFENTNLALNQVLETLRGGVNPEELSSTQEAQAYHQMYSLLEELMDAMESNEERLEEEAEEDEE